MGNFGGAILTIAGTIVGSAFGFPALGTLLGSLAGSLLFPAKLATINGPRLQDITQTNSTVGAPIPRGWGTFPAAGNVIAQTDLREVIQHEEVGGKGAPSQTVNTPTYYQDFAIGLNDSAIAGVRTIWANGKAIYDRRPRRPSESDDEFTARIAASDKLDQQMVVYLGSETQLPDPTLEAFYGVGEISAFRGLAYVVFVNWQNRPEDGNRMPAQWKFEVYTVGAATAQEAIEYSNEILLPWTDGSDDPRSDQGAYLYQYGISSFRSTLAAALADIPFVVGDEVGGLIGWSVGGGSSAISPYDPVGGGELTTLNLWFPRRSFSQIDSTATHPCNVACPPPTWWPGDGLGTFPHGVHNRGAPPGDQGGFYNCLDATQVYEHEDYGVAVKRIPQAPFDPCLAVGAVPLPELPGYSVIDGDLVRCGGWTLDSSQNYNVLATYADLASTVTQYPLNPCLPVGHADDTQAFWEAAYASAVAAGDMPPGLTYGLQYPFTDGQAYFRTNQQTTIDTDPVFVADIVADLCEEAGLQPSDFDTSDIDALTVTGYIRTRTTPARAAIDPLRQGFFFDGLESDGKIKFVRRGGQIRHVFIEDELGVAIQGDQLPSRVTTRKAQDPDLPRQVRIHYLSQARDYEQGEQDSPARNESGPGDVAVNDVDAELPMVLDDTEALHIAQALWADNWAGRWSHTIQTDARHHALEPAAVVGLPVDGRVVRARIDSIADVLPSLRKMDLTRDDDGAFVSYAIASEVPYIPPPINFTGPIETLLLDLPALRDIDDDAGFYAVARPYLATPFTGGALYRSVDGGGQFTMVTQFAGPATIGRLAADTDTGPSTIWQEGGEVLIDLQSGSLENRTEVAVLAGANALAVGAHGRWEIVQFQFAELVSDTTWRVSRLLRGRRGTEHNIGTSVVGDRVVLLSGSGVVRVPMDLARVGAVLQYRGVAVNGNLAAAATQDFTGQGEALRPFSPVALEASRVAFDMTVTWTRRSRLGQEMPSGADIAINEESELYEWELFDLADVLVDSGSVTAPEFTADLTGHDPDALYRARVYQMSADVGRGHVGEAIL